MAITEQTTNPTPVTPTACGAHVLIGRGEHSQVYHRPGSNWVVQTFKPNSPLTAQRLTWEFDYVRDAYATMPDLVGPQWLFRRRADAPLHQMILVKQYREVDPAKALLRVHTDELTAAERLQLAQFVAITRGLLARPVAGNVPDSGVPRLPDIIDDEFRNLAFDRSGRLRLIDTNELISTAYLYDLVGTSTTLDVQRRNIHAKFFARLLLLETLTGRGGPELVADPLYRSYLTAEQIGTLLSSAHDPALATPRSGRCQ